MIRSYENAKLRAQLFDKVSEQVDTTKGTSTNTKFANQSTERKPSLQPVRKNLVVRQPNAFQSEHTTSSKNRVPQKVDETNDLSKPVTSNSVPTPQESKIVKHDNVIAPGMFRINPFKPSREEKWSPTGRLFDIKGKIIASSESESQSDCSNGDNACTSNPSEPTNKRFPNSTSFFLAGTVRFGNDHVAAILGFGDLQWGNILITRVYFFEALGHNLFSVGQFCDSDLEVAFRRNTCLVRNLEGVDLLKGTVSTNLYTTIAMKFGLYIPNLPYGSSNFYHQWIVASTFIPPQL
ncbi:hypothetical protein Tco_0977334 [Tanacetum coccineum]|uniref:Integrase, catalytic region, zinc finger, CCHC-type, peptidase aspartic, catalytic n=1 Tax=Tanacetum coccineum TaxID=301880 RepID=A0ABQ5EKX1_9ASTR